MAASCARAAGRPRIGVPLSGDENDPVTKANVSAFTQALAELGWIDGSNLRIDLRGFAADMHMGVMDMSGFRMIPSGMGAHGAGAHAVAGDAVRICPIRCGWGGGGEPPCVILKSIGLLDCSSAP